MWCHVAFKLQEQQDHKTCNCNKTVQKFAQCLHGVEALNKNNTGKKMDASSVCDDASKHVRSGRWTSSPLISSPCLRGSWAHPCCLLTSSHLGGLNRHARQPPKGPLSLLNTWTPDLIYPRDPSLSVSDIISPVNPSLRQSPWFCCCFLSGQVLEFKEGFSPLSFCVCVCVCFSFCFFFFLLSPCLWLRPPAHAHMAQGSSTEGAYHWYHYDLRAILGGAT